MKVWYGALIKSSKQREHETWKVSDNALCGEVRGHMTAGEKIEVVPPARVFGDIEAPSVVISAGVVFEGNCSTELKEKAVEIKMAFLQGTSEINNGV